MRVTITKDATIKPKVLYRHANTTEETISLVVFNRAFAAQKVITSAEIGQVLEVEGHYEPATDGRFLRNFIVDTAKEILTPEELEARRIAANRASRLARQASEGK